MSIDVNRCQPSLGFRLESHDENTYPSLVHEENVGLLKLPSAVSNSPHWLEVLKSLKILDIV